MDKIIYVFFNDRRVGYLSKTKDGFIFKYDKDFLDSSDCFPIAYNFPLKSEEFTSKKLFPFFEGLVSEGWLLKIQSQSLKIDERDFFSMLIENGEDLIGGIRIKKAK
jgi:serine/threonine-protein kinase HipA